MEKIRKLIIYCVLFLINGWHYCMLFGTISFDYTYIFISLIYLYVSYLIIKEKKGYIIALIVAYAICLPLNYYLGDHTFDILRMHLCFTLFIIIMSIPKMTQGIEQ